MGLHQSRASIRSIDSDEAMEKQKVFRSLYIRDKNLAICRGSSSWLPTFDSSIPPLYGQADGDEIKYSPRIELAHIQDEIYRHLHSAEAPDLPPSKQSHLLSKLEQKLERWAATHQVIKKSASSSEGANLALSFFATRLCICRSSDDPRLSVLAFSDAKACCLFFLLATASKPDARFVETLDQLLGRKRPPSPLAMEKAEEESEASLSTQPPSLCGDNDTAASLPRLTAIFPLAAIFQVAKNSSLQPIAAPDATPNRPEEEMLLLETLRDRFTAATDHEQVENLVQKLGRTLDTMVRVIRQQRLPEAANTPSINFNDLSSLHSSASSGSQRGNTGGSREGSTPEPDAPFASTVTVAASEAANTSSMLLPFLQPFESPRSVSPWPSAANPNGGIGLSPWPGSSSYKQQQADPTGRVGKRPRLSSQTEVFDVFAEHMQGHGQRPEDDAMSMFNFFSGNDDIAVFGSED
jgi:hypothetical protein